MKSVDPSVPPLTPSNDLHQIPVLVDEKEAARILGVSPRSLQGWRVTHDSGLPFVRISPRCIRYRMTDLKEFIAARLCRTTTDYESQNIAA